MFEMTRIATVMERSQLSGEMFGEVQRRMAVLFDLGSGGGI